MAHLYGELSKRPSAALKAHLRTCTVCQEKYAGWKRTHSRLTRWTLRPTRPRILVRTAVPVLKWGLAALIVAGFGFGFGRFSAPDANVEAIRAAIEQPLRESLRTELREQLREEFRTDLQAATEESHRLWLEFADTCRALRQQDQRAVLTLLERGEQERQADHLELRRALETIAVVAADKFLQAQIELNQLAQDTQARFVQNDAAAEPYPPVNR